MILFVLMEVLMLKNNLNLFFLILSYLVSFSNLMASDFLLENNQDMFFYIRSLDHYEEVKDLFNKQDRKTVKDNVFTHLKCLSPDFEVIKKTNPFQKMFEESIKKRIIEYSTSSSFISDLNINFTNKAEKHELIYGLLNTLALFKLSFNMKKIAADFPCDRNGCFNIRLNVIDKILNDLFLKEINLTNEEISCFLELRKILLKIVSLETVKDRLQFVIGEYSEYFSFIYSIKDWINKLPQAKRSSYEIKALENSLLAVVNLLLSNYNSTKEDIFEKYDAFLLEFLAKKKYEKVSFELKKAIAYFTYLHIGCESIVDPFLYAKYMVDVPLVYNHIVHEINTLGVSPRRYLSKENLSIELYPNFDSLPSASPFFAAEHFIEKSVADILQELGESDVSTKINKKGKKKKVVKAEASSSILAAEIDFEDRDDVFLENFSLRKDQFATHRTKKITYHDRIKDWFTDPKKALFMQGYTEEKGDDLYKQRLLKIYGKELVAFHHRFPKVIDSLIMDNQKLTPIVESAQSFSFAVPGYYNDEKGKRNFGFFEIGYELKESSLGKSKKKTPLERFIFHRFFRPVAQFSDLFKENAQPSLPEDSLSEYEVLTAVDEEPKWTTVREEDGWEVQLKKESDGFIIVSHPEKISNYVLLSK